MKKTILVCCAFLMVAATNAQINTPAPSPASTLIQTVGLTEVTVDYSRPSMRGRTIFGGLEAYGKVWRTGANGRTKVTFSDDVTFGGTAVKAGTYALFTTPNPKSWDIYLYTDYAGGGAPKTLDESKIAAKVTAEVQQMPMSIETFTITIDDLKANGAVLGLLWENTYVGVEFTVPTDETVTANIDKVMNGPAAGDYYAAAVYYANSGKDIKQAKEWMDKAMSKTEKPAYWQLRQQSLILAKSGDKKGAIEVAKKSLAAAKEAGNDGYIKMNTDSLKEWGAK